MKKEENKKIDWEAIAILAAIAFLTVMVIIELYIFFSVLNLDVRSDDMSDELIMLHFIFLVLWLIVIKNIICNYLDKKPLTKE